MPLTQKVRPWLQTVLLTVRNQPSERGHKADVTPSGAKHFDIPAPDAALHSFT